MADSFQAREKDPATGFLAFWGLECLSTHSPATALGSASCSSAASLLLTAISAATTTTLSSAYLAALSATRTLRTTTSTKCATLLLTTNTLAFAQLLASLDRLQNAFPELLTSLHALLLHFVASRRRQRRRCETRTRFSYRNSDRQRLLDLQRYGVADANRQCEEENDRCFHGSCDSLLLCDQIADIAAGCGDVAFKPQAQHF